MSILLYGHWTATGDLEITGSVRLRDGDQEAIDALVADRVGDDGWACEYLVDRHREAVQLAHEELADGTTCVVDEVEGYEPVP
ncbi:hypothetical protein [Kitasatospora sp. NPDC088783]|uniref:hypothetical protein n=1 Tax=Kitasatospora sp. NPDC088783 TaxID=3364077 RepID=UPI00381EE248